MKLKRHKVIVRGDLIKSHPLFLIIIESKNRGKTPVILPLFFEWKYNFPIIRIIPIIVMNIK